MANTCYFEEPPERGPTPLKGSVNQCQSVAEAPLVIVGQSDAERKVLGLMHKYLAVPTAAASAVIIGPEGCGKSSLLSECARQAHMPVVSVRLSEIDSRGDLECLALERLYQLSPGAGSAGRGIVHIDAVANGSCGALSELVMLLQRTRDCSILVEGRRVRARSADFLWIAEVSSAQESDDASRLAEALCSHVIRLRQLTKSELFEVLAVSQLSPLNRIKSQLNDVGLELDLSELALWKLVEQGVARQPQSGAKALLREVAELEMAIWAQLAATNGGQQ